MKSGCTGPWSSGGSTEPSPPSPSVLGRLPAAQGQPRRGRDPSLQYVLRAALPCPWTDVSSAVPSSDPSASGSPRRRAWDARWARTVPALDRLIAGGTCRSVEAVERSLCLSCGTVQCRDPKGYAALWACCAACRDAERRSLWERAKQALDRAIAGLGSRSAYAVAGSLGIYYGTLGQWFPERYEQLVTLRAEHRKQASREVLDRRCIALRAAVFDLVRSGQHPSSPDALSYARLPPTLCRVPTVRPAFEAALAALWACAASAGRGECGPHTRAESQDKVLISPIVGFYTPPGTV